MDTDLVVEAIRGSWLYSAALFFGTLGMYFVGGALIITQWRYVRLVGYPVIVAATIPMYLLLSCIIPADVDLTVRSIILGALPSAVTAIMLFKAEDLRRSPAKEVK